MACEKVVGAEIWSFRKVGFGGSESTSRTVLVVDHQSLPDFFAEGGRGCRGSCLSNFWNHGPFQRHLWSKSEVVWNGAEFWTFLAPNSFGGGPQKIFGT